MDDILQVFVDNAIHDELQGDVRQSFDLLDFFDYKQAYSGLIDIVSDDNSQTLDTMRDVFLRELNTKIDYILEQHTVTVKPDTLLHDKNQICAAFAHVQNLKDYTPIIRILESLEGDDEQLAAILEELTTLTESHILDIIDGFSPSLLHRLKDYIYLKEEDVVDEDKTRAIKVAFLKDFAQLFGKESTGIMLLESGTLTGSKFETYLNLIDKEEIVTADNDVTAKNILSIIYLSEDGYNSPFLIYRKYSYQLLGDLDRTSAIEVKILNMIAKISELQKARNEATRLS